MKDYGDVLIVSDHKESIHVFQNYQPVLIIHRWNQLRMDQCYKRWHAMAIVLRKTKTITLDGLVKLADAYGFDIWYGGRRLGKLKLFGIRDYTDTRAIKKRRRK